MAKKNQATETVEMPEPETETTEQREVRERRKETRPSNVVFSEKAGNRLRLLEYQLDALVLQCRGRVARPTEAQFQWLSNWLREHVESTITAIKVELEKVEQKEASQERENVAVPI